MIIGRPLLAGRLLAGRRLRSGLQAAGWHARPTTRSLKMQATDSGDAAVPEVGWMWSTGGGTANKAGATRANLKQANIKAKKSLGQNFLTDEGILKNIVAAAGVTANDVVLEVGPGTGNLTRFLVATGAQVIAVEKDDTLIERLRKEFASTPNLRLVHGDILRVGIEGVINYMQEQHEVQQAAVAAGGDAEAAAAAVSLEQRRQQRDASTSGRGGAAGSWRQRGGGGGGGGAGSGSSGGGGALKVVANLPYNITKDFLKATLPLGGTVSELSIMIQHEVAERLVDPTPGRPDYRAMSVFTHFYSSPKYRLRIPRTKYFPVPGVDGALVTFRLVPPSRRAEVASERAFLAFVDKSFSERRKMMSNSLQPMFSSQQVKAALTACKLRPDSRAQDLSLAQFVAVHKELLRLLEAGGSSGGGGNNSSASDVAATSGAAAGSEQAAPAG